MYGPELSENRGNDLQRRVTFLLTRGIIFSIIWFFGIGSIIAVVSGLKARSIIKQAHQTENLTLRGRGGAKWCLIVGSLGILLALLIALAVILPIFLQRH